MYMVKKNINMTTSKLVFVYLVDLPMVYNGYILMILLIGRLNI